MSNGSFVTARQVCIRARLSVVPAERPKMTALAAEVQGLKPIAATRLSAWLKPCPDTKRLAKRALVTAPLLAVAFLLLTSCANEKHGTISAPETISGVPLLTARRSVIPDYVEATGTVRAAQSAQLASQVMGTITRVNVHEGDAVRRGQVLITIDEAQSRAAYQSATAGLQASQQSIAAADADYALAESTMKRYQMLYDKKSVSPQEYDEVKTKLAAAKARRDAAHANSAQAEAAVSEANTAVGFTRIRAPFDGLIIAKLADAGAMAAPGVPLLTLEDPSHFRLEANVDESQIGAVHLGANVPVVIDSLGNQETMGKVVQIVPAADPASRTFTVKIELPSNPQIRSGLFGRARVPQGERESILIPQAALLHRGQLDAVYVVGKDEIASLRYVTLGKPSASEIEVLSGLESGERIVRQPGERELSGKRIGAQ
jgi:RND family efflux transporter MFP subunit